MATKSIVEASGLRTACTAHSRFGSTLISRNAWLQLRQTLRLSERELQIVQCIFEDQKEESTAFDLGISPHTVNTYVQRLYSKLEVRSRPQLIVRIVAAYLAATEKSSAQDPSVRSAPDR